MCHAELGPQAGDELFVLHAIYFLANDDHSPRTSLPDSSSQQMRGMRMNDQSWITRTAATPTRSDEPAPGPAIPVTCGDLVVGSRSLRSRQDAQEGVSPCTPSLDGCPSVTVAELLP